jgi:hypothetical protein
MLVLQLMLLVCTAGSTNASSQLSTITTTAGTSAVITAAIA